MAFVRRFGVCTMLFFFVKQKTAYEMRISDWSSDVCSSDLLNYEEGGENCVLNGDPGSEQFLSEIIGAESYPDRHMSMESIYEYGSRAGVWRVLREFERRGLPLTVFAIGMALERNPAAARAFVALGPEVACPDYRGKSGRAS